MHLTLVDLKALRHKNGWSQQTVAERAPCSLSMYQLLEGGYSPANSQVLQRVIVALTHVEPAENGLDGKAAGDDGAYVPAD